MIKAAAAEPPAVSKARAFIAEHLGEPLSLTQVARAANMSAFYFCKIFKGATGLTFTDYVARARVEKTKQLLLNPERAGERGGLRGRLPVALAVQPGVPPNHRRVADDLIGTNFMMRQDAARSRSPREISARIAHNSATSAQREAAF